MKAILLVGGKGTRLYPLTMYTHKTLLPVYDKPMIYYPLAIIMEAKIKDVLIICNEEYVDKYKDTLGDGSRYGMNIIYRGEKVSRGIAYAFASSSDFVGNDDVFLLLGDNIFLGNMKQELMKAIDNLDKGINTVFGYKVSDPQRFGVVEFDNRGKALSIEEKPQNPKSNYAVTGMYFYKNEVLDYARNVKPSLRGEYEISDVNSICLKNNNLDVITLDNNKIIWMDAGTRDSLLEASLVVRDIEMKTNKKLGCIDEIAYKNGWISKNQLIANANSLYPSEYGKDLLKIAKKY